MMSRRKRVSSPLLEIREEGCQQGRNGPENHSRYDDPAQYSMAQALQGFPRVCDVAEMLGDHMHRRSSKDELPKTHEGDDQEQLHAHRDFKALQGTPQEKMKSKKGNACTCNWHKCLAWQGCNLWVAATSRQRIPQEAQPQS